MKLIANSRPTNLVGLTRRAVLYRATTTGIGLAIATCGLSAVAQSKKSQDNDIAISQLVDVSLSQQDVSKDYLIGARAGWQEVNLQGGIQGRRVRHTSVEVDGLGPDALTALSAARDNPANLALFGTAGHTAAHWVTQQLRQEKLAMAHIAPWLQVDTEATDVQTFPIFAGRNAQIAHALKNLSAMNVREIGAVFASDADFNLYKTEVERSAAAMQLKVQHFRNGRDMMGLGQRLKLDSPAIMLFLGGTPELAKFTQGLEQQARLRYCVALADVNLQTLAQMGAARRTPIVVTQVVPMVNAKVPVVRAYREVLSRLFDEPPTPVSLAGYIAARYAFEVINSIKEPLNRSSILAAFQRASNIDLGGFQVGGSRRSGAFVTQSMLTVDGRLVG